MIFEDRSSYDPAVDPVAKIVVTVECAPGQVESISDFLAEVAKRGGVYSVGCDVHIPEVELRFDVAEPEIPAETAAFFSPESEVSAHVPRETSDEQTEGEANAEPELQQASEPAEASAVIGSEAAPVGEPEPVDAGKDGELAGASGEERAGSLGGSAEAEDGEGRGDLK